MAALAGCGQVAPLRPAPGASLPVKPLTAAAQPDVDALLTLPPQARPERIDELNRRGEVRREDRFDLPPSSAPRDRPTAATTGGVAPTVPADPVTHSSAPPPPLPADPKE